MTVVEKSISDHSSSVGNIFAKRLELLSAPRLAEKWGQKKAFLKNLLFSAPIFLPAWFGRWHKHKILPDPLFSGQKFRIFLAITLAGAYIHAQLTAVIIPR